jgi:hypothetical protein
VLFIAAEQKTGGCRIEYPHRVVALLS